MSVNACHYKLGERSIDKEAPDEGDSPTEIAWSFSRGRFDEDHSGQVALHRQLCVVHEDDGRSCLLNDSHHSPDRQPVRLQLLTARRRRPAPGGNPSHHSGRNIGQRRAGHRGGTRCGFTHLAPPAETFRPGLATANARPPFVQAPPRSSDRSGSTSGDSLGRWGSRNMPPRSAGRTARRTTDT